MAKKEKTEDAIAILHGRYVKDDPERKAAIQQERVSAKVAGLIHDMRTAAGLSQKELAEMIDTTQSVISRLEDADYEGRSLSMLERIAKALNRELTVAMIASEPKTQGVRGKYYERYQEGSNVVLLDPEIAQVFHDSESVNEALRRYLSEHGVPPGRKATRSKAQQA